MCFFHFSVREVIISPMGKLLPYLTHDAYVQSCYLENLLATLSYLPSLRRNVLQIVINRAIQLDVSVFRSQLCFDLDVSLIVSE